MDIQLSFFSPTMISVLPPSSARILADLGYFPAEMSQRLIPKGLRLSTGISLFDAVIFITFFYWVWKYQEAFQKSTGLQTKPYLALLCSNNPVSSWYSRSVTPANTGTLPPVCSSGIRSPKWSGRSLVFEFSRSTIVSFGEAFLCEVLRHPNSQSSEFLS